jgi:hypothetical protein
MSHAVAMTVAPTARRAVTAQPPREANVRGVRSGGATEPIANGLCTIGRSYSIGTVTTSRPSMPAKSSGLHV